MSETSTTPPASAPFWQSRTIWANAVAVAASFLAPKIGITLDANTQVAILVVINLILRAVTKQPISWT